MKHVVIVPYYSDAEVARYVRIAAHLEALQPVAADHEYLLACSPRTAPSAELEKAFSRCGPVRTMSCRNTVRGHPRGPTAMFWEVLDHIAERAGVSSGGFALWLESDMLPVKADWLDHLDRQWCQPAQEPWVMGLRLPELVERRWFRSPRFTPRHINGGACYSKQLVQRLPAEARDGPLFDVNMFPFVRHEPLHRAVDSFAFSTTLTLRHDIEDPNVAVLHGWKQDKDLFIDLGIRTFDEVCRSREPQSSAPTRRLWQGRCCQFAVAQGTTFQCPLHSRHARSRAA